jgi:16S rRNA (guanine966-N2)-methyltransferase
VAPSVVSSSSAIEHALRALNDNLDALELGDRAKVLAADVMSVAGTSTPTSCSPTRPTTSTPGTELLGRVSADLVVAESGATVAAPAGWTVTRDKKYGRTRVTFLERTVDTPVGDAALGSDTR